MRALRLDFPELAVLGDADKLELASMLVRATTIGYYQIADDLEGESEAIRKEEVTK